MRIVVLLSFCLFAAQAMAQTSPYYVTQGPTAYTEHTFVFQGGTQTLKYGWQQPGERLVYVDDDQVAQLQFSGTMVTGHGYELDGTPNGIEYVCEKSGDVFDLAFDGAGVFMMEWPHGLVVRYEADFTNRQELFTSRPSELGITYDASTGTLFTTNWNDELLSQWSLTGELLGQWPTACPAGLAALAWDPEDDTLWGACNYVTYQHFRLMQFDREGELLQTVMRPYHFFLGGEIHGDYVKDGDGDGVEDGDDLCPGTAADAVTDEAGCALDQHCPCDFDWKNHGKYVACMQNAATAFLDGEFISQGEKQQAMVAAAKNGCGH